MGQPSSSLLEIDVGLQTRLAASSGIRFVVEGGDSSIITRRKEAGACLVRTGHSWLHDFGDCGSVSGGEVGKVRLDAPYGFVGLQPFVGGMRKRGLSARTAHRAVAPGVV